MNLHPAENRGYRELYVYARSLATHWPALAGRMAGLSAESRSLSVLSLPALADCQPPR